MQRHENNRVSKVMRSDSEGKIRQKINSGCMQSGLFNNLHCVSKNAPTLKRYSSEL